MGDRRGDPREKSTEWPLLVIDEGAGVVEDRWRLLAVANSSAWGNWVIWASGESASVAPVRGFRSQATALLIDDRVDGCGDAGEEAHAEAISQAAEGVLSCRASRSRRAGCDRR